ncbi:MAG: hypothetical protein KIT14_00295 [bacterium]|nr:hypothetical protein [bacterium]
MVPVPSGLIPLAVPPAPGMGPGLVLDVSGLCAAFAVLVLGLAAAVVVGTAERRRPPPRRRTTVTLRASPRRA